MEVFRIHKDLYIILTKKKVQKNYRRWKIINTNCISEKEKDPAVFDVYYKEKYIYLKLYDILRFTGDSVTPISYHTIMPYHHAIITCGIYSINTSLYF